MLASNSDLRLRLEGLAKERNGARLQLWPASLTGSTSNLHLQLFSDERGWSRLGNNRMVTPAW